MGKLVKGYWDCKSCGTEGISGEERNCPGCGKPRGDDVKFYMKDAVEYLSEEEAAHASREADWYCSFCDSLNPADATECKSCGASREDSEKNYFDLREKENQKLYEKARKENLAREAEYKAKSRSRLKKVLAVIAVLVVAGVFLLMPKTAKAEVTGFSWERTIPIEQYQDIEESDWELPTGANLHSQQQEVHHTEQVIDHYKTVEVQKSREVIDHYDTVTEYRDLGNGNFEEVSHQEPVYVTEYYTETEEEPVYRDEPVYQTKYYYDIWKWVEVRSVDTSGNDKNPEWGKVTLADGEREGERNAVYFAHVSSKKTGECKFPLDETNWNSLSKGDKLKVKKHAGGECELIGPGGDVISKISK